VVVHVFIFGAELHLRIGERLDGCRGIRVFCTVAVNSDRLLYPDGVNTVPARPVLHFRFSCRTRISVAMTGHRDNLIWTASRICAVWCRTPCRFPACPATKKQWCGVDPWNGRLGWRCFVSASRPISNWSMPRRIRSVTEAAGFWVPD